jgi:hypothetical protein
MLRDWKLKKSLTTACRYSMFDKEPEPPFFSQLKLIGSS